MIWLKQSTAVAISFGPFVDPTDGVTLKTGLVSAIDHASTGIKLSKNGGALTIRHATVTASSYDAYGNYLVTLDTTDTNTLGTLRAQFADATTNLVVWQDFMIVPANVWDSFFGASLLAVAPDAATVRTALGLASANLDTQLAEIEGETDDIAAVKAKTDNLPSDPADASDIAGAFSTVNSTLSTIAGYVDTEVAAIKAKTDNLPASPAAVSDIPSAATIAAAVWAYTVEGSYTALQYIRIALSALGGKLSGAGTSTESIRNTGDTKDRIVATVDANGNRTAVMLDGT